MSANRAEAGGGGGAGRGDAADVRTHARSTSDAGGARAPARALVLTLERLRLVRCVRTRDGRVVGTTNLTLLNALLVLRGVRLTAVDDAAPREDPSIAVRRTADSPRVSEHDLWRMTMAVQVLASVGAFGVRSVSYTHLRAHET